ncbi:hypothetical protein F5Y11DRAFT_367480 [Daldinia sp. FL1419]|nr:hypothetical protein F5Y11DRAFT_367480 [Daldinia sp. FL1419]
MSSSTVTPYEIPGPDRLRQETRQLGLGHLWKDFEYKLPELFPDDASKSRVGVAAADGQKVHWVSTQMNYMKFSSKDEDFMSCYSTFTPEKTDTLFRICYNIRHFERHHRDLEDPWPCRQSALHQSLSAISGHPTWVIIQPPEIFDLALSSTPYPMTVHLRYLQAALANFWAVNFGCTVLRTVIFETSTKDLMFGSSIVPAAYLLEQGADINARAGTKAKSALQRAALRKSAKGAEMVRFLLLNGADPEVIRMLMSSGYPAGRISKNIREEAGVKNIHRWLGKTWDELVEETKSARKEKEIMRALMSGVEEHE